MSNDNLIIYDNSYVQRIERLKAEAVKKKTDIAVDNPLFASHGGNADGLQFSSQSDVKLDQNSKQLLVNNLNEDYKELSEEFNNTKEHQGFLGKFWDGCKNTIGVSKEGKSNLNPLKWWGYVCNKDTGSKNVEKNLAEQKETLAELSKNSDKLTPDMYEKITGNKLTAEELQKVQKGENILSGSKAGQTVKNYEDSQKMAVDVMADLAAGVSSMAIYTGAIIAAAPTGGASLAIGVAAATASAAAIKSGIKYADAATGGRKYDSLKMDLLTGSVNGLLAPITGGIGGAAGKLATQTVLKKAGIEAVKELGKGAIAQGTKEAAKRGIIETVKQGTKTVLTNATGYKYVGGNIFAKAAAYGTEMAVDGSLGGALDNSVRHVAETKSLNGVGGAFLQGGLGGAVMAPVIGGGFKGAGKVGGKIAKTIKISGKTIDAPTTTTSPKEVAEENPFTTVAKTADEIEAKPKSKEDREIKSEKATDSDIEQLYELEKQSFRAEEVPPTLAGYKAEIADLNTFVVRDKNNELIGYYQTELDADGDALYLSSIAFADKIKGSKKALGAFKQIEQEVREQAKEAGVNTVSLHVDAENQQLVKLYKKFGFEIKDTEANYFENGNSAHYMTTSVDNEVNVYPTKGQKVEEIPAIVEEENPFAKVSEETEVKKTAEAETVQPKAEAETTQPKAEIEAEVQAPKAKAQSNIEKYNLEDAVNYAAKSDVQCKYSHYDNVEAFIESNTDAKVSYDHARNEAIEVLNSFNYGDEMNLALIQLFKQSHFSKNQFEKRIKKYIEPAAEQNPSTINTSQRFLELMPMHQGDFINLQHILDMPEEKYNLCKKLGILNTTFRAKDEIKSFLELDDAMRTAFVKIAQNPLCEGLRYHEVYQLASRNTLNLDNLDRFKDMYEPVGRSLEKRPEANELRYLAEMEDSHVTNMKNRGLLRYIEGRKNKLSASCAVSLSEVDENTWKIIQERGLLKDIPNRCTQFDNDAGLHYGDIAFCSSLPEEEWKKVVDRNLLASFKHRNELNPKEIETLIKFNDDEFNSVSSLLSVDGRRKNQLSINTIEKIAKLEGTYKDDIIKIAKVMKSEPDKNSSIIEEFLPKATPEETTASTIKTEEMNSIIKALSSSINDDKFCPDENCLKTLAQNFNGNTNQLIVKLLDSLSSKETRFNKYNIEDFTKIMPTENTTEALGLVSIGRISPELLKRTFKEGLLSQETAPSMLKLAKILNSNTHLNALGDIDNSNFNNVLYGIFTTVKKNNFSKESIDSLIKATEAKLPDGSSRFDVSAIEVLAPDILANKAGNLFKNLNDPDLVYENLTSALYSITPENKGLAIKLAKDGLDNSMICNVLPTINEQKYSQVKKVIENAQQNKHILQAYGKEKLTNEKINDFFAQNFDKVMYANELCGEGTVKHAFGLKLEGLRDFIFETEVVYNSLSPENLTKLKQKLSDINQPVEIIEKVKCLNALKQSEISTEEMAKAIDMIKSPKATQKQMDVAERLFGTDKSYDAQIEEFLTAFSVPEANRDIMRNSLKNAKLNDKYEVPASIDEQIARASKAMDATKQNTKMPAEARDARIKELEAQIADMQANPENYTQRRMSTKAKNPLAKMIECHINLPNGKTEWNNFINKKVFETIGVEYDEKLAQRLNFNRDYLADLLSGMSNPETKANMQKLIALLKANPDKSFTDIRKSLPHNQKTEAMFNENGLDYEKWLKTDKDSYLPLKVEIDQQEALDGVVKSFLDDFNSTDFKALDEAETQKLLTALSKEGFKVTEDAITINEQAVTNKDLEKFIKVIKEEINSNPYWEKSTGNSSHDNARNNVADHFLKLRRNDIDRLAQTQKNGSFDLEVRRWDAENIGKNLFAGNEASCCTAISGQGGMNSFAAPQHLMNSFVSAIELMDNGKSAGNTMCYFAEVDGKLSFIIDNIELKQEYRFNDQIRNAIFDYAKQLTKDMQLPNQKQDIPVYLGPNYNKVNVTSFDSAEHSIKPLGSSNDEQTYVDALGGRIIVGDNTFEDKKLYKVH